MITIMRHKKIKKNSGNATRAKVLREMKKPRMARSAKIAELKLDTARISQRPAVTLAGIVDRIFPSSRASRRERVQVTVQGADRGHRELRIENTLTDEFGDDARLRKGAHVEVTVTAEQETLTPETGEDS
jgi:hypothetical protein